MLLIHADPGARSAFIAAWLNNTLSGGAFDVGLSDAATHIKVHNLTDRRMLSNHLGTSIRIQPTFARLSLHCLLFLRKNVYVQQPDFTRDEHSLETFSKIWGFIKNIFEEHSKTDPTLYNYVINFEDTFDINALCDLYAKVNGRMPAQDEIDKAIATNASSNIHLDKNHACSIAAELYKVEQQHQLLESQRHWSIVDVYKTAPTTELFDTVIGNVQQDQYTRNEYV
jgi:hypothetical protein